MHMDTQPYRPHLYSPTTPVPQLPASPPVNASLPDSSWHSSPDDPSPSTHSPHMYPLSNGTSDHLEYPSLSAHYVSQSQTDPYNTPEDEQSLLPSPLQQDTPPGIAQVEPTVSPGRVLTRRQRALLQQNGRRPSDQSPVSNEVILSNSPHSGVYFIPPATSSPHTPPLVDTPELYPTPPENSSLNIDSPSLSLQLPSAPFPSPATSMGSPYSPYGVNTAHSRSTSTSNSNPRSISPALSVVSALTSVSSASAPMSQPLPFTLPEVQSPITPRQKQRKQRLFNVDRKAICEFHKRHPNARQEDIASRYRVERSTISKILKHKTKWLNVPDNEGMRVAKHRPSKFPGIENHLQGWLIEVGNSIPLTDASIRQKAKEVAQMLNISEDKFKASSGWVENFKHRHGIRGGVWTGDGKNTRMVRALGLGTPDESATSLPPPARSSTYRPAPIGRVLPVYNGTIGSSIDPTRPPHIDGMHRGHPLDHSQALHSIWHSPPTPSSSLLPPVHSIDRSHLSPIHHSPTSLIPGHYHPQPHPQPVMQYGHSAMPPHEPTHESNLHPGHHQDSESHQNTPNYDGIMRLHPTAPSPRFRPDAVPSISEAEDACHILMKYLDVCQPTLLGPQEREVLQVVQNALFQIGHGLPSDRRDI